MYHATQCRGFKGCCLLIDDPSVDSRPPAIAEEHPRSQALVSQRQRTSSFDQISKSSTDVAKLAQQALA